MTFQAKMKSVQVVAGRIGEKAEKDPFFVIRNGAVCGPSVFQRPHSVRVSDGAQAQIEFCVIYGLSNTSLPDHCVFTA